MKTKLFICNTPYQLLMACNHAVSNKEDKIDVIISDHFSGSDKIVERINNESLIFRKAYYVPDLNFCRRREEWNYRINSRLLYGINIKKVFESFVTIEDIYDELWIANWEEFSNVTWNYLIRYNNPNARCIYYEDGYNALLLDWRISSIEFDNKSKLREYYEKRILNIKYTLSSLSEYHVLHPELMQFDPGCPIVRDEYNVMYNKNAIEDINRIFDYYNMPDIYDRKVIFFEESFYAEGIDINDMEIVDYIATILGKENIIVKIHPRSPRNRWEEKGYMTNKNTSIPWEVVLLNQDMSDKIMISIISNSMISTCLTYKIVGKLISLWDVISQDNTKLVNNALLYELFDSIVRILKANYSRDVFFPNSKEDLERIIGDL